MGTDPGEQAGSPSVQGDRVPLARLFGVFLMIGATSFGGGVVAYLRSSLVTRQRWLDDEEFLTALEISQALPGLNATNMSIIVGDRLRGVIGAAVAFAGMTLPGASLVFALGVLYAANRHDPTVNAALIGVGAAAVGLLVSVTLQLGRKQLGHALDIAIVVVVVALISVFHVSLVVVLVTVTPVAIYLYRPRALVPAPAVPSGLDKKPAD
ncbi:chromate transporter [Chelatococcus reniformis]|uniref:Chromate transporter n=1 Tax=Chelatococcus reniformis TaxID=1494448 RepID=A0A916U1C9_9HYPH|nr:chromate transporter [Chelatococcus reniformis]GGC56744.1 chromate transporter [Chelatococcus reniformis]